MRLAAIPNPPLLSPSTEPLGATLRVVGSLLPEGATKGTLPKPPPEASVALAAQRLAELGVQVLSQGRYSVAVRLSAEQFENVLGIAHPGRRGFAQDLQPKAASLVGLIDRVEVAPPLIYFA